MDSDAHFEVFEIDYLSNLFDDFNHVESELDD